MLENSSRISSHSHICVALLYVVIMIWSNSCVFVIMVIIIVCVLWYVKFMLFLSSCYYLVENCFFCGLALYVLFLSISSCCLYGLFLHTYYMFCNFSSATTLYNFYVMSMMILLCVLLCFVCLPLHTYIHTLKTHHGILQLLVCNYSMLWVWYYVFCFMFVLPFAFTHTHTHCDTHMQKTHQGDDTLF